MYIYRYTYILYIFFVVVDVCWCLWFNSIQFNFAAKILVKQKKIKQYEHVFVTAPDGGVPEVFYYCFSIIFKCKIIQIFLGKERREESPLQPGVQCGPASPAGLGRRDTGTGWSHIWTDLEERSGRREKDKKDRRQFHICPQSPQKVKSDI